MCVNFFRTILVLTALRLTSCSTQYFLQLKNDVLECRLNCNYEQAVVLASYSLQAELGDFDADRHSAQYIREFSLFPRVRCREALCMFGVGKGKGRGVIILDLQIVSPRVNTGLRFRS